MTNILQKVSKLLFSSFQQTALIQGISDILVVKWDSGQYRSTPFVVCFGHKATTAEKNNVKVYTNNMLLNKINFTLDKYGYLHPMYPSQQLFAKLHLKYGRNTIKFEVDQNFSIQAQIHLYSEHDKILVSDMDGTLTKDDLGGLYSNYYDKHYLHDGYHDLVQTAYKNGYKIVWLTMRSLPLYKFSKDYIHKHTKVQGVLLTQPQQFFPAVKKQILKQTGNVKTNMMLAIKKLFPQQNNPFIGGLGNRENDAIAYRAAGIPLQNIFIVDTQSKVHHLGNNKLYLTYSQMCKNIQKYFPKHQAKSSMLSLAFQSHRNSKRNSIKVIENNTRFINSK